MVSIAFNPTLGLILTFLNGRMPHTLHNFQSYLRSDSDSSLTSTSSGRYLSFNPTLGLILTDAGSQEPGNADSFQSYLRSDSDPLSLIIKHESFILSILP